MYSPAGTEAKESNFCKAASSNNLLSEITPVHITPSWTEKSFGTTSKATPLHQHTAFCYGGTTTQQQRSNAMTRSGRRNRYQENPAVLGYSTKHHTEATCKEREAGSHHTVFPILLFKAIDNVMLVPLLSSALE